MLGCVLEQVNHGCNPHITEKLLTWTLNHNSNSDVVVERQTLNEEVHGSIPTGVTVLCL